MSASYGTLRAPYWFIAINGSPYLTSTGGPPKVFSITVTAGFDQQVIEATIKVATDDGHPNFGDWIEIFMGATIGTATCRFAGYFMEFDYTLHPREVSLICKSPLVRAQSYENPLINGTDLSLRGAGQTDNAIVSQILSTCGLTGGYHYSVPTPGGLGRILGKIATQYYTWSEGDDGLSAIELIDEICCGYRTFDQIAPDGWVQTVRQAVSIVPVGPPQMVFNQGYDILEATNQVSVIPARNQFLITGYNSSTYKNNTNGYPLPPIGGPPLKSSLPFPSQYWFSSSLIEYDTEANRLAAGALVGKNLGVSCQEIAEWAATEYNRLIIKTPFTTHRDDPINPGAVIAVIAPGAQIGTIWGSSLYFVQNVTNEIDEAGTYSQKIVGIQGADS